MIKQEPAPPAGDRLLSAHDALTWPLRPAAAAPPGLASRAGRRGSAPSQNGPARTTDTETDMAAAAQRREKDRHGRQSPQPSDWQTTASVAKRLSKAQQPSKGCMHDRASFAAAARLNRSEAVPHHQQPVQQPRELRVARLAARVPQLFAVVRAHHALDECLHGLERVVASAGG